MKSDTPDLRGGWFDPFGKTAERRLERRLAQMYLAMVEALLQADRGS